MNTSDILTYTGQVPSVSTQEMIEVDRAMMEDYGIDLAQMMENAGRNLAHLARLRFLDGQPQGKKVVILAGTGGNGGGALACARRLHIWGASVRVFATRPDADLAPVPAHQLAILRRMEVPVASASEVSGAESPDLIVDGLIGYSLKGNPRGAAANLIRWANGQDAPILALDVPSGLGTTPAIRATATMTLALPKEGLRAAGAEERVGELYLADISVPPSLYAQPPLGLKVGHIFAESDIIRLR